MVQPPSGVPPRAASPQSDAAAAEALHAALGRVAAVTGCAQRTDAYGVQSEPPAPIADVHAGFVAALTDLSLLTVSGADAVTFLHAQLTQDVAGLTPGTARLAGYCSPKGRLLATFAMWRRADAIGLVVSQPLAAGLRKRLQMYVLRAKAGVRDAAADTVVIGAAGPRGQAALQALGVTPPAALATAVLPADAAAPGSQAAPPADSGPTGAAGIVLGLPPAGAGPDALARWLLVLPAAALARAWPLLTAHAPAAGSALWRWTEIASGIARIVPATAERFVPQMLNYELAGGVDFRKGCYPGQEVVARSQYLGKLKRRMFAAQVDAAEPAPGADVLADGAREPAGQVVMAAPDPAGGVALLYEAHAEQARGAVLRLDAGGAALTPRELPYPLPG